MIGKKQIKRASQELNSYLQAWKAGDHKEMVEYCTHTWKCEHPDIGHEILELWYQNNLQDFSIVSSRQTGNASLDFIVKATLNSGEKTVDRVRLVCEKRCYAPTLDGRWGVNPVSGLRLIRKDPDTTKLIPS